MRTLSGSSDEISPDFDAQCGLVFELGLKYPEFRSALGGFSGPELFTDAWRAFTDIILNTEQYPYV